MCRLLSPPLRACVAVPLPSAFGGCEGGAAASSRAAHCQQLPAPEAVCTEENVQDFEFQALGRFGAELAVPDLRCVFAYDKHVCSATHLAYLRHAVDCEGAPVTLLASQLVAAAGGLHVCSVGYLNDLADYLCGGPVVVTGYRLCGEDDDDSGLFTAPREVACVALLPQTARAALVKVAGDYIGAALELHLRNGVAWLQGSGHAGFNQRLRRHGVVSAVVPQPPGAWDAVAGAGPAFVNAVLAALFEPGELARRASAAPQGAVAGRAAGAAAPVEHTHAATAATAAVAGASARAVTSEAAGADAHAASAAAAAHETELLCGAPRAVERTRGCSR